MSRQAPTLVALFTSICVIVGFAVYWNIGSRPYSLPPAGHSAWVGAAAALTTVVCWFLCRRAGSFRSLAWLLTAVHSLIVAVSMAAAFWFRMSHQYSPRGEPNITWLLLPFRTVFVLVPVAGAFMLVHAFASWRRSRPAR